MKSQYIDEMVLESQMFDNARAGFNVILQKMLRKMIDSDVGKGVINLKFTIELNKSMVENYEKGADGEERVCIKPKFDHKVSSQVSVNDESKGSTDPDVEIRWDAEKNCFVTMPVANTGQKSMFDDDMLGEDVDDEDDGIPKLPGPTNLIGKKTTLQDTLNGEDYFEGYDYDDPDDEDDSDEDDGSEGDS